MELSKYNMEVLENNLKTLRDAGVKVRVMNQPSDIDMILKVEKAGIENKKLIYIHEGKVVAGITA